ncbi:hypothetical protein [Anaerococcus sp. Marseille-Q7828]|uniref:hypothetical protein n=1 Tax=Anaerococcus sp. Marseille-Q7828 TaxID=3036300 RepID=UPI0024ACD4C0|nr:hypothetical protein [Anaerococcus sp. Marseille-Q7828]
MKINKKIAATGLALSFAFLGLMGNFDRSYAAGVNKNSAFYRSSKTRDAYLALTDNQRAELDSMNTDKRTPLTIDELLATNRYSLPIVRGRDWLYPFMLDRNKNGEVGENYFKGNNSGSSSENTGEVEEYVPGEVEENIPEVEENIPEEENGNILEEVEALENRAKIKADLEKSIENAKIQIDACEDIIENYPKTIEKVKDKLIGLLAETKEYIKTAEELLETL